ncbi:sugar ABC transporter permease [Nakamurella flavida]|uniref:Sugar ABC transporter permease n=1 Tax=Nakamurella flavida TaxID=363630 RepID=A0A938YS93_9ACTN|nr:sugar ABC transporter permease [Nakamurella flavida]MBM9477940.1 sugar ABC transporter permease [Nakamurella flavida]MDP9778344.1 multiple sugar transport system permease protein [Nakamurella flavida]
MSTGTLDRASSTVPASSRVAAFVDRRIGWILVLPTAAAVVLVCIFPLIQAVQISFQDNKLRNPSPQFIGLDNYQALLSDPAVWHSLWISAVFVGLSVLFSYVIGLGLAVLLNRPMRGRGLVRAAIIIPWAVPAFVAALVWAWMYNDQFGIINSMLNDVGVDNPPTWLDQTWALLSLIVVMVWKSFPFQFVMLLAGLQSIPKELYESASVDGAGKWRQFFSITLPMLRPVSSIAILLAAINAFHYFPIPWIMTQGGPSKATDVIPVATYNIAFNAGDLGYGSAAAVFMFLVILLAALPFLRSYYRELKQS